MEHTATHQNEHGNGGTKEIIKVTVILSVLTLIELAIGYYMISVPEGGFRLALKGSIVILMMVKAFYIVAYFMHLKHELKNMIMTIVVPLLLFVWFILAFLYDGDSYKKLKNTYDTHYKETSTQKVEKKAEHGGSTKHGEEAKEIHK